MRRKSALIVIGTVMAAVILCSTLAKGDVIHLKDGRKLEGKIVSETEEHVRLKADLQPEQHIVKK